MWDRPDFLDLPARPGKPRVDGLTHVLDKGVPIPALDGVLAETGAKDGRVPVVPVHWVDEMRRDLDAGARWVIAEGRESGTVGLFRRDGSVREELVEAIANHVPLDRVIFEAPLKAQQAWFIRFLGPGVNLGNVPPEEMLPLETLRLGLRADTAPTRMLR